MDKRAAVVLVLLGLATFAGVGYVRILVNPANENFPAENQAKITFFPGYENYLDREFHYSPVGSSSMVPTFGVGDTVVWVEVNPAELKENDIIIFKHPTLTGGPLWAHRILEITISYGKFQFRTKGDNNLKPDKHLVPESNLCGLVIGVL